MAIDIGTTTVTVVLFRLGDREQLASVSELNHQASHGSDVLSRIDAANSIGVEPLRRLIVDQLDRMLAAALGAAGVEASAVTRATITGNTTMLHFLTGLEVASLGVTPFTPVSRFGTTVPAAEVLPRLGSAELYLPPAISTYVGPDITCGLLATGLGSHTEAELLIDVGTNGEMALAAADACGAAPLLPVRPSRVPRSPPGCRPCRGRSRTSGSRPASCVTRRSGTSAPRACAAPA